MSIWDLFGGRPGTTDENPDYYSEGLELASQERFHEALTSFRLALRESPTDVATLEQMAVVYTRMGVTDEAVKMYKRALEKDPTSAGAHYGIAFLLLNKGCGDEAVAHLERFLETGGHLPGTGRHVEHARQTLDELRSADITENRPDDEA
ncbi:MAG: tetratricopeptide repeat protein [Gemmatimonadota bacterium]|nr:tetratricopeptide repeat protein [Gemmatimonadota bacterium]MDH3427693.1 tetratricopeptide repeat protein [Gemmatimonadota bacterium]